MADDKKKSLQQRWNDLQPSKTMLVWSCVGSVAVALVVGFTWGGWVTGGTARDMAGDAGSTSRYELASVICVERFLEAPDAEAQLAELKAHRQLLSPAAVHRGRRLGDHAEQGQGRPADRRPVRQGPGRA